MQLEQACAFAHQRCPWTFGKNEGREKTKIGAVIFETKMRTCMRTCRKFFPHEN